MADGIHHDDSGGSLVIYDLEIRVVAPTEKATLSAFEKQALFQKPNITDKRAKQAGAAVRAVPVAALATGVATELTLTEIGEGYSEIIDRANALLDNLKKRVGGLTLEFNPRQQPELAQAVIDNFKGEDRRITYSMYLEALRLDKDIAIAIGEQSHGLA